MHDKRWVRVSIDDHKKAQTEEILPDNSHQIPNAAGTKMGLTSPRLVSMAALNVQLPPSQTYPIEAV